MNIYIYIHINKLLPKAQCEAQTHEIATSAFSVTGQRGGEDQHPATYEIQRRE